MNPNTLTESLRQARSQGKKAAAKLARRVLPHASVTLTHVEPGVTLAVDLKRHVMFWSGGLSRFEPFTVRTLRSAVQFGDTVFDIGANIGFFSTLLSRWVGPSGRVLAFEPEPENLRMLGDNLASNHCDNVTVVASAVGAEPGMASFSLDGATGATGSLGSAATPGETAFGGGKLRLIETRVETIDDLIACGQGVPAVIKMDIEGGEVHALRGARKTLEDHRPIVVSELAGDEGYLVIDVLDDHDYVMWDLETRRTVVPGDHPFMVVGIPKETHESDRARRIIASLSGGK